MSDRCSKCGEVRLLGAEHSCAAVTAACEVCGRPKGPPGDWDESEFICWNDRHCHRLGCEREKAAREAAEKRANLAGDFPRRVIASIKPQKPHRVECASCSGLRPSGKNTTLVKHGDRLLCYACHAEAVGGVPPADERAHTTESRAIAPPTNFIRGRGWAER